MLDFLYLVELIPETFPSYAYSNLEYLYFINGREKAGRLAVTGDYSTHGMMRCIRGLKYYYDELFWSYDYDDAVIIMIWLTVLLLVLAVLSVLGIAGSALSINKLREFKVGVMVLDCFVIFMTGAIVLLLSTALENLPYLRALFHIALIVFCIYTFVIRRPFWKKALALAPHAFFGLLFSGVFLYFYEIIPEMWMFLAGMVLLPVAAAASVAYRTERSPAVFWSALGSTFSRVLLFLILIFLIPSIQEYMQMQNQTRPWNPAETYYQRTPDALNDNLFFKPPDGSPNRITRQRIDQIDRFMELTGKPKPDWKGIK